MNSRRDLLARYKITIPTSLDSKHYVRVSCARVLGTSTVTRVGTALKYTRGI